MIDVTDAGAPTFVMRAAIINVDGTAGSEGGPTAVSDLLHQWNEHTFESGDPREIRIQLQTKGGVTVTLSRSPNAVAVDIVV